MCIRDRLTRVSLQLTELNAELASREREGGELQENESWNSLLTLQAELDEKNKLLHEFRSQGGGGKFSSAEFWEKQITEVNKKYGSGRQKILNMVSELETRDQLLRTLGASPVELEDETRSALLGETVKDIGGSYELKEETVEDLPAIPYPSDEDI